MKKIISMGIASALLALTSVAAFAANPDGACVKVEKTSGDYTTGSTVIYTVKAVQDGVTDGELIVEYKGLEFVDYTDSNSEYDDGTKKIAFSKGRGYKAGDDVIALTFKVTAAENEEVSIKISGNEGQGYGDIVDTTADTVTGTVGGGATTPGNNEDPTNPNNPDSGIALAVVPAVIAGAAVVVAAKKRK